MTAIKLTLAVLLLVFPLSVFAQTSLDGYFWDKSGDIFKPVILASFLGGFRQGKIRGIMDTMEAISDVLSRYPPDKEETQEKETKALDMLFALLKVTREALHTDVLKDSGRNIEFYRKEVDAFYQTFPLCRRRNIFLMLSDLLAVWEGKKSYKETGDQCLESPKK